MSGSAHGHTTAAWTGVTISFIGFLLAGVAMVIPSPILVIVGLVLALVGPGVGKMLSAAGYGKKVDTAPKVDTAKKTPVGTGASH